MSIELDIERLGIAVIYEAAHRDGRQQEKQREQEKEYTFAHARSHALPRPHRGMQILQYLKSILVGLDHASMR
jgi:hypothetical protein